MDKKKFLLLWFSLIYSATLMAQNQHNLLHPIIKGYGGVIPIETSIAPKNPPKVIIDITSDSPSKEQVNPGLDRIARLLNLYGVSDIDMAQAEIVVIIHSKTTIIALKDDVYASHFGVKNPNMELLSLLRQQNVKIMVCGQSLDKQYGVEMVNEYVDVALSAITTLAEYQQNGFSVLYF